jgi:hypothetical protein
MVLISGINCSVDISGYQTQLSDQRAIHTLHQFVHILKRRDCAVILIELKKISYWGNIFFNSAAGLLKTAVKKQAWACPKLSFAII